MDTTGTGGSRTLFLFWYLLKQRYIRQQARIQAQADADVVSAAAQTSRALAVAIRAIDKAVKELQEAQRVLASMAEVVATAEALMSNRKQY